MRLDMLIYHGERTTIGTYALRSGPISTIYGPDENGVIWEAFSGKMFVSCAHSIYSTLGRSIPSTYV